MEEDKDILNHLKKASKPDVPEGFFENFYDELMAKIAEQESSLNNFQKTTKPDVPTGFFEKFSQEMHQQTSEQKPTAQVKAAHEDALVGNRSVRIINLKRIGIITAVAACLLVVFLILPPKTNETAKNETESTQLPVEEAALSHEDLYTYVDEHDIIDYILEEDIELVGTTNENTTTKTSTQASVDNSDELDEDDIFFYLEEDLDDINIDDLEL